MLADTELRVLLVEPQGPLGEALARALLRLGAAVTCFGSGHLPEGDGITPVPGDRRRPGDLDGIGPGEFDAAIDFGARSLEDPVLLAACLRGRVGLVVQLGTWRVYAGGADAPDCRGGAMHQTTHAATPPAARATARSASHPASHPAAHLMAEPTAVGEPPMPVPCPESAPKRDGTALNAEDGLWNARAGGDYRATVLRLACLYGPGVRLAREWYVVGRLRAGRRRMALPDGGGQLLHRLYLDNAVHAIVCALNHPREADGHAFNVGDTRVPTAAEIAAGCAAAAGRPLEVIPLPRAVWDGCCPWAVPRPVVLDLHRLRARLGYAEPVPPEEGLSRTVRWLWEMPEDDVLPVLDPYWRRFGCGHDYTAEEAALARWEGWTRA